MKKLLIGLMAFASFAATAASFSYQGVLKTADGKEVENKNPAITFRLYDKAESELTQALWGRKIAVLLDKDGLFNVELRDSAGNAVKGLENTLDQVLSQYGNSTLYIGLEVEKSSGEIRPRQKVLAVPTASFAQDVKTARNGFSVTGKLTVNGEAISPIPRGVIVAWYGEVDSIPKGWALCDGNNGTPDLRGKFVKGSEIETLEFSGGLKEGGFTVETMARETSRMMICYYELCFIMKL